MVYMLGTDKKPEARFKAFGRLYTHMVGVSSSHCSILPGPGMIESEKEKNLPQDRWSHYTRTQNPGYYKPTLTALYIEHCTFSPHLLQNSAY